MIEPFIDITRAFIKKEKQRFVNMLEPCDTIQLFASETYFILAQLTGFMTSDELCRIAGQKKILIRDCSNFDGLSDRFVSFSLKTRDINTRLAGPIGVAMKK